MAIKQALKAASGVAVIYARYSSHSQNDASIEQQVEECEAYAAANNLQVTTIYADRHLTGTTDKRPEFHRMVHDAHTHKFQFIITWKVDRFARCREDAAIYKGRLRRDGVKVLYAKEVIPEGSAGVLLEGMLETTAEWYSVALSENVTRGMRSNAMECKVNNGGLPFGYKRGADGKYEIIPEKAEIVREIFRRVQRGDAFVDIADDLNSRGVKTIRGGSWNKSSFHRMMVNERYIGVYQWQDVRIEDGIPPIVDKALFAAVQQRLGNKPHPQGRKSPCAEYLLTGKLFCGKCGSHMVGVSGTSRTLEKHHYYGCQQKRRTGTCDKKNIQRDYIERLVAQAVQEHIMNDDVLEWITAQAIEYQRSDAGSSKLSSLQAQLAEVKKSKANIMNAIEQGIFTATVRDRLLELEEQEKVIDQGIEAESYQRKVFTEEEILYYLEQFRKGDANDRAYQERVIDMFVSAVYLYDDDIRIAFSYTGKRNEVTKKLMDRASVEHADGSYKLATRPPMANWSNHCGLYRIQDTFVLVLPVQQK